MGISLLALIEAADEIGVKLEVVQGLPMWEAYPSYGHQEVIDEIRATLRTDPVHATGGSGCHSTSDSLIQFPDGSLKRPDIAIYCVKPPRVFEPLKQVPDAVIEVVSQGYEKKDLEIDPPFYLSQGVKDVVTFEPISGAVMHYTQSEARDLKSPVTIRFSIGCVVNI